MGRPDLMMETDATRPRVQRELSREEALERLGSVSLGRVVFTDQALPAIRPVNHLLADGHVVFRSHAGAAVVTAAEHGVVVAYEADALDPAERTGWSVVVTGVARLVHDPESVAHYQRLLQPWVDRPMDQVVAISLDIVTGFVLTSEPGP